MPFAGCLLGPCRGGHTVNVQLALPPSQFLLKALVLEFHRNLWPTSFKTKPNLAPATAAHRGGQCREWWPAVAPGDRPGDQLLEAPLGGTAPPLSPCWLEGLPDHPTLVLHVERQRKAVRGDRMRTGCGGG